MNALVATDLDRTMIYSRAAMGDEQFAALETVCVEIYRDAPLSYMTTTAVELMTRLAREVVVVPTTTRTPAQYARIDLPGSPFHHAVVSNGGRILVDGADAEDSVRTAVIVVDAADLGDEDAELIVGDAQDNYMAFYDPSELPALVELL